jgi:NADPH:quinone reductase-like Zn-dependent oxidoreductase
MKAVVLREFGGPEVLHLEDVPTPEPSAGEILVKVHAVSVNRVLDLEVRRDGGGRQLELPIVLGVDPSGEVVATGSGVTAPAIGTRVALFGRSPCGKCELCLKGDVAGCRHPQTLGVSRWGGYADYVVAPAASAFALPPVLDYAEGTLITRHFPAAYNLLLDRAGLQADEWVLIMGAAGALASCGVQVSKSVGALVIGAAGADERVELARRLGADFGVNYRSQDLHEQVMRITDGRGVDVVFENVGDPVLWPRAFDSLAVHGRLVTAGAHGGGVVTWNLRRRYQRALHLIGG